MFDFNTFGELYKATGGVLTLEDAHMLDDTAREIGAKNITEIGSRQGASSVILGTVAKDLGGVLTCVEPRDWSRWEANIKHWAVGSHIRRVRAWSPWINPDDLETPIDYLFHDADHRSLPIIADIFYLFPFVRIGGRIAIHDWNGAGAVKMWVKRACFMITADLPLGFVCHTEQSDRGTIIFEKEADWERAKR